MISISPYKEKFEYTADAAGQRLLIDEFVGKGGRKTVVVQGLGFVGSTMAAVLANARDSKNRLLYNVIGVDRADEQNYWKIGRVNKGNPPVLSSDSTLEEYYRNSLKNGNLIATSCTYAYTKADVVVVDIHLDISKKTAGKPYEYDFSYDDYIKSLRDVAEQIRENTLVVIETTVPAGMSAKVIYPLFKDVFAERGLDIGHFYLGYSYERVMPGPAYIDSIIHLHRVYSGIDMASKARTRTFLETFIDTAHYPLCEMSSTTAAEMAKVLENSYRAANIAFIQEWTEFAQISGVDLYEVISAIRARPTHANIMSPGFGVGGYCLTKDALLADWSYRHIFGGNGHLRMSVDAIGINDLMPDYTFGLLKKEFPSLNGMYITILGISYLKDTADTRYSPSERFYDSCLKENANITIHDTHVTFWKEKKMYINTDINSLRNNRHDVLVFAVNHEAYHRLSKSDIRSIFGSVKLIIDANNAISDKTAVLLVKSGIRLIGVGKGHWQRFAEGRRGE